MHFELKYKILDRILRHKREKLKLIGRRKQHTPPKSTYKKLVCITGFGHSGSGTVLDYLSEFDNCTTKGFRDTDKSYSSTIKKDDNIEFGLLTHNYGLFDLEKLFKENANHYNNTIMIPNFLKMADYYCASGGIYTDKFMELTFQFINKITDFKIAEPRCCTYFSKQISVKEYRKIAKEYLHSFLNTIDSKDFLVLDQALTTFTLEFEKKQDYLGDYKLICVYRDPRDVFTTGVQKNEFFLPKNPVDFVKWFKRTKIKEYLSDNYPNKLMFRFEDFVLNYNEIAQKINNFLGLDVSNHIHKNEYFNPKISKKNIGIYKTYHNQEHIKYIEENLKEFCY